MNKILIQFPEAEKYRDEIDRLLDEKLMPIYLPEHVEQEELEKHLSDAEVIFGDVEPALLGLAKKLSWLQISWAGAMPYVEAVKDGICAKEVILTNASGAYGVTIAEHAAAMILALSRRLPAYERNRICSTWHDEGAEWILSHKKALILGTGDLGTQLAIRLKAFGMEITGFRRTPHEGECPFDCFVTKEDGFLQALTEADLICGCLPGTPDTAYLLDEKRLRGTKREAILINVGRGNLIDTQALIALLKEGHFFGVGLDVTEPEPLYQEHPLWNFENVIITPHVAGVGFEHHTVVGDAIWRIALTNLANYMKKKPLTHVVDYRYGY